MPSRLLAHLFGKTTSPAITWLRRILGVWFLVWAIVGLFVLSLNIELPLRGWGDLLFNLLGALLILCAAAITWGNARALSVCLLVCCLSAFVEHLGATRGFLFGSYAYTGNFGPQIAGTVPVAVPVAWWAIIVGAVQTVALATRSLPQGLRWFLLVANGAALAVLTDLPLETVAFHIREYWLWNGGGPWYGVPTSNFVGWLALGGTLAVVVLAGAGDNLRTAWERLGAWPPLVLLCMHLSFAAANLAHGFVLPGCVALFNAAWAAWAVRAALLTTESAGSRPD